MPNGIYTTELPASQQSVWDFVQDMNNWAPLVPGYQEHKQLSDNQFTWSFKADLGFIKRDVQLQIDFKEWQEPTKVTFDLIGLTDNFTGEGYFQTEPINEEQTRLFGYLDITAKGPMSSMINSFLKNGVPQIVEELSKVIAEKIIAIEQNRV